MKLKLRNAKVIQLIYNEKVSTSVEVDGVDTLKALGSQMGLYFTQGTDERIILKDGKLIRQANISYHGSPCWEDVSVLISDKEQIKLYKKFNEILDFYKSKEDN